MDRYENLLKKCEHSGIDVYERKMVNKGLYCDGYVWINKSLSTNEKVAILAEEMGHHFTSSGNILDQKFINNRIQESRARFWSYVELLKEDDIKLAIKKSACRNMYELAEELNVDEEFLKETIKYYENNKAVLFKEEENLYEE